MVMEKVPPRGCTKKKAYPRDRSLGNANTSERERAIGQEAPRRPPKRTDVRRRSQERAASRKRK